MRLRSKLAIYLLLTIGVFVVIFLLIAPWLLERVNVFQADLQLIAQREHTIEIILRHGSDALIQEYQSGRPLPVGLFKQEFFQLERIQTDSLWNFIEIESHYIDGEWIDYRMLNYAFQIDEQAYSLKIGTSLEQIFQTESNLRAITLILLVLFIVGLYLINTALSRIIAMPLEKITNKLKDCNSPQLYDHTPVKTTTTDFVYLDQSLSDLMRKVDELLAKEREVTANISHELLTPVSVVQSKLENIINDNEISYPIAIKVTESLKTLNRLKVIINSLMLIARVENNQFLKTDSFWIGELLEELIDEISPIADENAIKIVFQCSDNYFYENANRALIYTLLFNIINNAVKHSGNGVGNKIEIKCAKILDNYSITISDNGPGMTQEQASEIFKRFKRKGTQHGHGLGLAIANSIAEFHNMQIQLDTQLGNGSRFTIVFPKIG